MTTHVQINGDILKAIHRLLSGRMVQKQLLNFPAPEGVIRGSIDHEMKIAELQGLFEESEWLKTDGPTSEQRAEVIRMSHIQHAMLGEALSYADESIIRDDLYNAAEVRAGIPGIEQIDVSAIDGLAAETVKLLARARQLIKPIAGENEFVLVGLFPKGKLRRIELSNGYWWVKLPGEPVQLRQLLHGPTGWEVHYGPNRQGMLEDMIERGWEVLYKVTAFQEPGDEDQ